MKDHIILIKVSDSRRGDSYVSVGDLRTKEDAFKYLYLYKTISSLEKSKLDHLSDYDFLRWVSDLDDCDPLYKAFDIALLRSSPKDWIVVSNAEPSEMVDERKIKKECVEFLSKKYEEYKVQLLEDEDEELKELNERKYELESELSTIERDIDKRTQELERIRKELKK